MFSIERRKKRHTTMKNTNHKPLFSGPMKLLMVGLVFALLFIAPSFISGFTQSGVSFFIGNGIPMGHEWLARRSAIELLLGKDPLMPPDPDDPRLHWTRGLAKNTDISTPEARREVQRIKALPYRDQRYQSTYKPIYDAIIGERWVDIGGFNVTNSTIGKYNGFYAVAQEPANVQYDHFMRHYDDRGPEGGLKAIRKSRDRFREYFVHAAMAKPTAIKVWDGGGYAVLTEVDKNYFLFGRAMHLFQDSFSSEHSVRIRADMFEKVRQVKSYLCASGSEQHSHSHARILDYSSGDVIWKPGTQLEFGWQSYKPSNMKDIALVAMEASKDLWAAFIRTMGHPYEIRHQVAHKEAKRLVENWLGYNETEIRSWYDDQNNRDNTYVLDVGQTGKGQSVSTCMKEQGTASGSQLEKVRQLEKAQRICLYNIKSEPGYSDLFDSSLWMPINWTWKDKLRWKTPPESWQIPTQPAYPGIRVKIKSVANGHYMTAPDGLGNDNWIYCKPGIPIEFILVGDTKEGYYIRAAKASLFLSYRATTGAVKLYDSPNAAEFNIETLSNGTYAIKSRVWNQYIWLSGESPYLTKAGNPNNKNTQWIIEGYTQSIK